MVTTYVALASMVPSCRQYREPDRVCVEHSDPTQPNVGFPVAFGGLGAVVLGGLIVVTAVEHSELPRAGTPAMPVPPEEPAPLDETDAFGMAVAQLALTGIDCDAKPPRRLLSVDDTQSSLHVQGRRAELWNLRVRTASDETWLTVGARYEYKNVWQLMWLGTTLGCAR